MQPPLSSLLHSPGPQSSQPVEPAFANLPAAQGTHSSPSKDHRIPHDVQSVRSAFGSQPAPQFKQVPPVPAVPTGQRSQPPLPALGCWPSPQGVHSVCVAGSRADWASHDTHAVRKGFGSVPAPQSVHTPKLPMAAPVQSRQPVRLLVGPCPGSQLRQVVRCSLTTAGSRQGWHSIPKLEVVSPVHA